MYIPKGKWYDYWTKTPVQGGKEQWVDADIDSMPLFVKEGTILPKYPLQQYVGELDIKQVELEVYYGLGKNASKLYEDAQDGYDYTKDRYSYRTFKMFGRENDWIIQQHKRGDFETSYDTFRIHLIGLPFEIKEIELDNHQVSFKDVEFDPITCALIIKKDFTELHLSGS